MNQPDSVHADGVYFYNRGLYFETNHQHKVNDKTWYMDTVDGHMKTLKVPHLSLLKIDTEGAEWGAFKQMIRDGTFENVDQVLFEIHFWGDINQNIDTWYGVFKGLEKLGFKLFFSHVNPASNLVRFPNDFYLPCCYELGFVKIK